MVAEVIVDIAHSEVDRVFDYLCGDEVCAGMRVTVPFARSVTTGIVMRVKEGSELPPEKLKKIIRVLDELPALNAECLALAEKLARRYRCPKALVLRLFLPAEMRTGKVSERAPRKAAERTCRIFIFPRRGGPHCSARRVRLRRQGARGAGDAAHG